MSWRTLGIISIWVAGFLYTIELMSCNIAWNIGQIGQKTGEVLLPPVSAYPSFYSNFFVVFLLVLGIVMIVMDIWINKGK